jgi:hypothetical protein
VSLPKRKKKGTLKVGPEMVVDVYSLAAQQARATRSTYKYDFRSRSALL